MMIRVTAPLVALAMGVGLCACGTASPAASSAFEDTSANRAAASPVAVSPEPGTPDASPSTQISFLGPQGTHVADVHVVGSHSGVHAGVLRAYSTGTGESFLPARQFTRRRACEGQRAGQRGLGELCGRAPASRSHIRRA